MNDHVHPLIAEILNTYAGLPQAANAAAVACQVKVSGADLHETFVGLYPTTGHALDAGFDRAGTAACAVSVLRLL